MKDSRPKGKIVRKVQIDKEVQVKEFDVDSDENTMGVARATALFSGTPAAEPATEPLPGVSAIFSQAPMADVYVWCHLSSRA